MQRSPTADQTFQPSADCFDFWQLRHIFDDEEALQRANEGSSETTTFHRWLRANNHLKCMAMPLHLEGRAGAVTGRRLTVSREKPFIIRAKTTNHDGQIQIAWSDGCFRLDNQSHMRCRINGQEQQRAVLTDRDELEIGKDVFQVAIDAAEQAVIAEEFELEGYETSSEAASESNSKNEPAVDDDQSENDTEEKPKIKDEVAPVSYRCDVCDVAIHPDAVARHMDAKGVVHGTLTCDSCTIGVDIPPGFDEQAETAAVARSRATTQDETERTENPRRGGEQDRHRQSRRISASRLAAIEPVQPKGLLRKMTRVFARKDDREVRLRELEEQRRALLLEVGRHALAAGGNMGLPDEAIRTLLAGGDVKILARDLNAGDLDRWRTQRQQMGLLDAEIAALRRGLGLGQDARTHNEQAPALRTDQKAMQERTFATLDGMGTDELSSVDDSAEISDPPESAPKPPSISNRLRLGARKRR